MASSNCGGYEYSFVDENLDKYTCETICSNVLRDPHLTECCGQHFCESCLKNWFSKHGKESCPHCRAEGREFVHVLDKKFKREIDSLRIHCTNKKDGCEWIGELGSLKDHLESDNGCDCVEVLCPNRCTYTYCYSSTWLCMYCASYNFDGGTSCVTCGAGFKRTTVTLQTRMNRKDLADHLKNDCPHRPYACKYCGHRDTYKNITGADENGETHYDKCMEYTIRCPNKCDVRSIKRKNLPRHRRKCPLEPIQCPLEEIGCKVKLVRHELEQHLSSTQQQHQRLIRAFKMEISRAKEKNVELQEEISQLNLDMLLAEEEKQRLQADNSELSDKNLKLHQKNSRMEQQLSITEIQLSTTEIQLLTTEIQLLTMKKENLMLETKNCQLTKDSDSMTRCCFCTGVVAFVLIIITIFMIFELQTCKQKI